jgi:hypothetical protein
MTPLAPRISLPSGLPLAPWLPRIGAEARPVVADAVPVAAGAAPPAERSDREPVEA